MHALWSEVNWFYVHHVFLVNACGGTTTRVKTMLQVSQQTILAISLQKPALSEDSHCLIASLVLFLMLRTFEGNGYTFKVKLDAKWLSFVEAIILLRWIWSSTTKLSETESWSTLLSLYSILVVVATTCCKCCSKPSYQSPKSSNTCWRQSLLHCFSCLRS